MGIATPGLVRRLRYLGADWSTGLATHAAQRYHLDQGPSRAHSRWASHMPAAPAEPMPWPVVEAWATHCHPDARETLGGDVVMAAPPSVAEQAAAIAPAILAIVDKKQPKGEMQ